MKSLYLLLKQSFLYKIAHPINVVNNRRRRNLRNRYFKKEADSLLRLFTTTMKRNQILAWLDYGTLLGFYREHDFISHDCDLDFGSFLSNQPKIRQSLLSSGFKLVREFHSLEDGGMEECYMYKHTTLDVFYYRKEESLLKCNGFRPLETINVFTLKRKIPAKVEEYTMPNVGFAEVDFKNNRVWIPKETDTYLKMNYGDTFMIPDSNFKYYDIATNVSYYDYSEKPGVAIYYKLV